MKNSVRGGLKGWILAAGMIATLTSARGDDWPQWLGPRRDGVWRETGILEAFPKEGPKVLWRVPVGAGYTGPAVASGRVYLMDRLPAAQSEKPASAFDRGLIRGRERVLCLDERDGRTLWAHEYDCAYDISYPAGPRATPVVDDGRVYTLGAMGHLICFEAATGKVIWQRDLRKDYGVEAPMWGFACHPLVDGEKLICQFGREGNLASAFDKATGRELWKALSAREPGYAPPMIYEAGGKRQLILWTPESVNSVDPENGKLYWTHPFKTKAGLTVSTPRRLGDDLLVTCFYNGSLMLRLKRDRPAATELWRGRSFNERRTDGLHSIISTPFLEDGHIYGVCSYGQLRCLKASTGERVWETLAATGGAETRWGNAFIIKQGNRFFLPNERGELIIARLTPAGYQEISRTRLLEPTNRDPGREVVWSHPAFANRNVYARNDKEAVCISLKDKEDSGKSK